MQRWALILGASSGFGEAAARALAEAGHSIVGVHLDRRATLPHVQDVIAAIEATGQKASYHNVNAADPEQREGVLDTVQELLGDNRVNILLHSLAFGTLGPFVGDGALTQAQMDMTLRVMAHSLVDWTQALRKRDLIADGGRIFAMTSSGSSRVIPTYGAVSAAKAALEAHCRQLAAELAPARITVNALRGGVTDTPALRKIPGHDRLLQGATLRNPSGRLTRPEDVARAIVALSSPDSYWITGNVINVDGGEEVMA